MTDWAELDEMDFEDASHAMDLFSDEQVLSIWRGKPKELTVNTTKLGRRGCALGYQLTKATNSATTTDQKLVHAGAAYVRAQLLLRVFGVAFAVVLGAMIDRELMERSKPG